MDTEAATARSGASHTVGGASTEYRGPVLVDASGPKAAGTSPAQAHPRYRTIMAVDIESSTLRNNSAKAELRRVLYRLLLEAFGRAGIEDRHIDSLADRGDGVLALIQPFDEVPKTLLLNTVVPALGALLAEHNAGLSSAAAADRGLRIRVVVHAGETHRDRHGTYGEALDVACRLLDSPETKEALRRTDGPLVLVVSEDVYHSIVRQGYVGIEADAYVPLVHVNVGHRRHRGWVHDAAARSAAGVTALERRELLWHGQSVPS